MTSIRPDIVDQGSTNIAREIIGGATVTNRRAIGIDGAREVSVYGPEISRHFIVTREVPTELVKNEIRAAAHLVQQHALEAYNLDEIIEQRISRELNDILRTVGFPASPSQIWGEWERRRSAAAAARRG